MDVEITHNILRSTESVNVSDTIEKMFQNQPQTHLDIACSSPRGGTYEKSLNGMKLILEASMKTSFNKIGITEYCFPLNNDI